MTRSTRNNDGTAAIGGVDASGNYTELAVDDNGNASTKSSAAMGAVAAYGSNSAALTANTDYSFKWGAGGTTVVNHIMIQNNDTNNLHFELDAAANAGSALLVPGQILFLDVQTVALHYYSAGTPNVNGSSANNIVTRGWL